MITIDWHTTPHSAKSEEINRSSIRNQSCARCNRGNENQTETKIRLMHLLDKTNGNVPPRHYRCCVAFWLTRLGHMTPCFDDWRRFCFVLRQIAKGENGRPLSGAEAQKRARVVLTECGYTWSGYKPAGKPIAATDQPSQPKRRARRSA